MKLVPCPHAGISNRPSSQGNDITRSHHHVMSLPGSPKEGGGAGSSSFVICHPCFFSCGASPLMRHHLQVGTSKTEGKGEAARLQSNPPPGPPPSPENPEGEGGASRGNKLHPLGTVPRAGYPQVLPLLRLCLHPIIYSLLSSTPHWLSNSEKQVCFPVPFLPEL